LEKSSRKKGTEELGGGKNKKKGEKRKKKKSRISVKAESMRISVRQVEQKGEISRGGVYHIFGKRNRSFSNRDSGKGRNFSVMKDQNWKSRKEYQTLWLAGQKDTPSRRWANCIELPLKPKI